MTRDEKIKVLIADDSELFRRSLAEYIEGQMDMEVTAIACDGEEAVKMILEQKPDIALIDLLMPLKDGFGVLEELQSNDINYTSCIMISAISLDSMATKSLSLGAKYYVIKPYRKEFLAGRIRQVYAEMKKDADSRNFNRDRFLEEKKSSAIKREAETAEQRISQILSRMNISASIKGYYYLRSALLRVLEDQEAIIGITKKMYPDIAKEFKTTSSKVERAIRHAIESAWKRGGSGYYSELVGVDFATKPTNGQFIAAMGEYLRLNDRVYKTTQISS